MYSVHVDTHSGQLSIHYIHECTQDTVPFDVCLIHSATNTVRLNAGVVLVRPINNGCPWFYAPTCDYGGCTGLNVTHSSAQWAVSFNIRLYDIIQTMKMYVHQISLPDQMQIDARTQVSINGITLHRPVNIVPPPPMAAGYKYELTMCVHAPARRAYGEH